MPNPKGNSESLTPMGSPWLHKPTRTIRVPVIFADEALAFTRKLDRSETTDTVIETSDTEDERIKKLETELAQVLAQSDKLKEKREKWINELLEENGRLAHRVRELEGTGVLLRIEEKKNKELEQERKELRKQLNELLELQTSQAQELREVRTQLSTQTSPDSDFLELLPKMPPHPQTQQLPDLYAARDAIMSRWSLARRNEKRERFWAFANAMIEEAAKLDPNYSLLARLQSDLKQEQEYSKGLAKGMSEEFTKRVNIEKKMGLRR